jgi:alkylation response protein AidB-like acyl-CoA dehydrogenase
MDFRFNEEQLELQSIAEAFLQEHSDSEQVRKAMESELGYDAAIWQMMGSELGWPSVHVPEEYGGLGLSYVELVVLLEVMGGALACAPFFSSVCLGANALLVAGSEAQKQAHLPGIAEGQTRATLAWTGPAGRNGAEAVEATAERSGDSFTLNGSAMYVLDGHSADLLIVAARTPGSDASEGISLFALPGTSAGVSRRALPTMDQTRRLAEITLNEVVLGADALLGPEGDGWPALEKTLQLAAVGLAAEQVGGAQKCLDMSVGYAKERTQFGRPIGSFQAIKHKCADMMVEVESARSAAYYAACVIAEESDELASCASLAKAYCSDTYFHCAAEAIQIHGGVGFTWEYDVHLHFKRAKSGESFLGDPAHHRELVARQIGL